MSSLVPLKYEPAPQLLLTWLVEHCAQQMLCYHAGCGIRYIYGRYLFEEHSSSFFKFICMLIFEN